MSCFSGKDSGLDYCVYRITPEDFLNVVEAHAVATAYPNPGGNMLNICSALQNAQVEVYDMNGRLIHSQALTGNVTAIDAADWASGTYVWKVFSNGKEAETGKWIKE